MPIAQKSIADAAVTAELGGFFSGVLVATSVTYQQAGPMQFGFTNSNPDFTKDGNHMWSISLTQEFYQTRAAQWVAGSYRRTSVVYLESGWGKNSFGILEAVTAKAGLEVVCESPIQPDSEDYRSVLIETRDVGLQAVVHLGYGPDGACVVRRLRGVGFTGQLFDGQNTPQFLETAGSAAGRMIIIENFLIGNDSSAAVDFNKRFKDRFGYDPSTFSAYAYDALNMLAKTIRCDGVTREDVFGALFDGGRQKTVQLGEFEFSADRHPSDVIFLLVAIKNGAHVPAEAS